MRTNRERHDSHARRRIVRGALGTSNKEVYVKYLYFYEGILE